MSRTLFRRLGAAPVAFAVFTLVMAAPGDQGSWELGPYIGRVWWDDYAPFKPKNDLLLGARLGYFLTPSFSLEASYQRAFSETSRATGQRDFDLDAIRLNGLWNFRPGEAFRPFVTIGAGRDSLDLEGSRTQRDVGLNAGGGLRWVLSDNAGVRIDGRYARHRVNEDSLDDQSNFELTVGVSFMLGGGPPKDSDGDGVRDGRDRCPDTPRGAIVDENGCPKDSDGDGVFDGPDACPDTPKGWPVDARGCPIDTDGDGVPDGRDRCPDTPRGAKVDADGCPIDSDGDGVPDGLDACPDTPRGTKVDTRGCPLDSDGDGVPDDRDKCPNTPRGTKVDENGCPPPAPPPPAPVFPEGKKALILEGVNFDTDKWDIKPEGMDVLDRVAASLRDWPDVRVEVGGHTDSTGGAAHNAALSQKRAESVMRYLASKGVPSAQMTAKGYGESKPMADNATKEGKARNRRTELVKIE